MKTRDHGPGPERLPEEAGPRAEAEVARDRKLSPVAMETEDGRPRPVPRSGPGASEDAAASAMAARPRFLPPLREPQMLRVRPTSLRAQDASLPLWRVFRGLGALEAVGEELGASLVRARGSDDPAHRRFVEELRQVRPQEAAQATAGAHGKAGCSS